MSWLSEALNGGQSAVNKAQNYLNQIPNTGRQYNLPYIQGGQQAGDILTTQYGNMASDPQEFINSIMRNYKPSEGYQFQKGELEKEAGNAAAAGGIAGTPYHQQQQAQLVQQLLSTDMQNWLNNVLGVQRTGLQGEQNLFNTGYDASGRQSDLETNALNQQAGLAYQGQSQKNNAHNQLIQAIIKALPSILGAGWQGFTNNRDMLSSDMYGGS